ncbi:MAG: alkyl sulfatase dimerization domain-containing protein [Candidatus Thorarchaeota archaeon]
MIEYDEGIQKFIGNFPPQTFGDGICHMIGGFGNVGIVETSEGLIIFDLATRQFGKRIFNALRAITDKPIKFIIYSHGHFDHCYGFSPFIKEIEEKEWQMPQIIAHENLLNRFEKYRILDNYHNWINSQQFASIGGKKGRATSAQKTLNPTILMKGNEDFSFDFGGYQFQLYHNMGETDDAIWMYFPEKEVIFAGDLMISSFPNVGNPYKVQRYPKHWAIAMEKMIEKDAKFLVPGHGGLIKGRNEIKDILSITAEVMHFVHDEVVKRLNEGKWFEEIYHEMLEIYPIRFKNHWILKPVYGCYEFAIHATYRLYHGWYDTGNPTDLFPAKTRDIAKEFLRLNSVKNYLDHAKNLNLEGRYQLSLHIIDVVINGLQDTTSDNLLKAYELKYDVLKKLAKKQTSFIAFNILNNGATSIKEALNDIKARL